MKQKSVYYSPRTDVLEDDFRESLLCASLGGSNEDYTVDPDDIVF